MNHPIAWVKLEKYLELSGETKDAVFNRRKTGKWRDGVESKLVDGRLWINLQKVEQWIMSDGTQRNRAA